MSRATVMESTLDELLADHLEEAVAAYNGDDPPVTRSRSREWGSGTDDMTDKDFSQMIATAGAQVAVKYRCRRTWAEARRHGGEGCALPERVPWETGSVLDEVG